MFYRVTKKPGEFLNQFPLAAFSFFLMLVTSQVALPAPPINDDFANASTLTGEMVEVFGDNTEATMQPGEPDFAAGSSHQSVWWKWTAPYSGTFRLSTEGSRFNATFHVFIGDAITNLVVQMPGGFSTFQAVGGTTYWIRIVGHYSSGAGIFRMAIYPERAPNDAFENRIKVAPGAGQTTGTTSGATPHRDDPPLHYSGYGRTVWYEWTAPDHGRLNLTVTNYSGHRLIQFNVGAFLGQELHKLKAVATGHHRTTLIVSAGQTYLIAVDGDGGDFQLVFDYYSIALPSNDHFANREVLTGSSLVVTNDNTRASGEGGERGKGDPASLWYEWVSPASGGVHLLAQGDRFPPQVQVYQGNSIGNLKLISEAASTSYYTNAFCQFGAIAGETYLFRLGGAENGARGKLTFALDLTTVHLQGISAFATISAATPPALSINQPSLEIDGNIQSVAFYAVTPRGQTELIGVATNAPFSIVPTNLRPGFTTVFAIATNSLGIERTSFTIPIRVRPRNDDFSHRTILEGYQWEAVGYTSHATREPGEKGAGPGSVWWSWTAPSDGTLDIYGMLASDWPNRNKQTFALYTGTDPTRLKRVRWNKVIREFDNPNHYLLNVTEGTTYHLGIFGKKPLMDSGMAAYVVHGIMRTVSFVTPQGDSFMEPATVPIEIQTTENPNSIDHIEIIAWEGFYDPGKVIGVLSAPPWRLEWTNPPPNIYTLQARMVKKQGPQPLPDNAGFTVRPKNDLFERRILVPSNSSFLTQRLAGASREPDEPAHVRDPWGGSGWWTWTAPVDGRLLIGNPNSANNHVVNVYTGDTLQELERVAEPDWLHNISLDVFAGKTYQIAVIPRHSPEVDIKFRFYPPPPNDNFENRIHLSGYSARDTGYTVGATIQRDEPGHGGHVRDHTVWWSWTAPQSGLLTLQAGGDSWVLGSVYTGNSFQTLVPISEIGSFSKPVKIEVRAGVTYQIALVSYWGDYDLLNLQLDLSPLPSQDQFGESVLLEGPSIDFQIQNWGATAEQGEPPLNARGSGRTLWWAWVAPSNGSAFVAVGRPGVIQVFTGETLKTLQPLAGGEGTRAMFRAAANQIYHLRYDSSVPTETIGSLVFHAAPSNDDFVNATVVHLGDTIQGTLKGAGLEPNQPVIQDAADHMVWFQWIATKDEPVIVASPSHYPVQVFTGDELPNLVTAGIRTYNNTAKFQAIAGSTYHVALAGGAFWEPDFPDWGPFELLIFGGDTPPNDNFVNAEWLAGTEGSLTATNWAATGEPHEPGWHPWWPTVQRTLWYQWRPPGSGMLQFIDTGSTVPPQFAMYLGNELKQLQFVGNGEGAVLSHEALKIVLDGQNARGGFFKVNYLFTPAPPNDDIENATRVFGTDFELQQYVRSATGQSTNLWERSTFAWRDVWWLWTTSASGSVVITNNQPDSRTGIFIYTGPDHSHLTAVPLQSYGGDGRAVRFDAKAATQYWIRGTWSAGTDADNIWLSVRQIGAGSQAAQQSSRLGTQSILPDERWAEPSLKLFLLPRSENEGSLLEIRGISGTRYLLEFSTDLQVWHELKTGFLEKAREQILDPEAASAAQRFYRVRQ